MQVCARVTELAREGVVVGLSIWWKKLSPDGSNANQVTSQALTDLGGSATFYDCLVEVQRIDVYQQETFDENWQMASKPVVGTTEPSG